METNLLSKYILCDPDSCPIATKCPRGPMPNMPCFMKEEFAAYTDRSIAEIFVHMEESPETSLRINILLKPLFEQLLKLRLAELTYGSVFTGIKLNGIYSEIRKCVMAINAILTETVRAYKADTEVKKLTTGTLGSLIKNKGYYEMLCYDGESSVETRVGP